MNDFKTILTLGAGRILLGFAVGTYSWAADPDPPPPLGKLYEVGGHKMPLYATGSATNGPSVVLEAGAGAFSIDWYLVQQEVARFAAVCSYDRAGHAKPLVVLARKSDEKALMEGRESFQNLSSNSAFAVSEFAVHEIPLAQPDLVVNAIRAVVESVRTGGKLRFPISGAP